MTPKKGLPINLSARVLMFAAIMITAETVSAQIIEVEAGTDWFNSITTEITAGDTLLFISDGGVYNSPETVSLPPVPLTLMAAPALQQKPVLKTDVAGSMLRIYADLTVIGLAFDGAYAERGESGGTYRFIQGMDNINMLDIRNSDFFNLRGYGITSTDTDIDTLLITNSIFFDFNRIPVYFNDRRALVGYARITNSTFHNISNIGIYIWDAYKGFEVSKCTFSGLTNINLYPKDIVQNMVIRDNIIASVNSIGVKVYGDNPVVEYNLFHNNSTDIEYMGGGIPDFHTNRYGDPLFEDAAGGRFALHTTSPAAGTASDGGNMGDPRWGLIEEDSAVVNVTFSVSVPDYTPATDAVYLVGTFNDWNPGLQAMEETGAFQWQITLGLPVNSTFEYKYTRGSWDNVEKDADGGEIDNRSLTTEEIPVMRTDTVASWADITGPVEIGITPPVLTFYDSESQHNIAITWISALPGTARVEYGVDDVTENTHTLIDYDDLIGEGDNLVHRVRLEGLVENTTYQYRIVTDEGYEGEICTFRTAPYSDAFMFIVGGDNQLEVYPPVVTRMAEQDAAFMLHAGDLVVDGVRIPEWLTFLDTFRELSPYIPVMPVYGNHESDSPNLGKVFTLPPNNDADNDNENHWYSFRYNNVFFIGLDVYRDFAEGSSQYNWLVNELQGVDRNEIDHLIVWLHYGPYASLGYHGPNTLVRQRLGPLFLQYGVDVTFSGHNHFYERSIVDGIPHFVTGGLSIWLKDFQPDSNPWSGYVEKTNHFLKVFIDGSKMRVEMMRHDGTIGDVYENMQVDSRDIDWESNMVVPVVDQEDLMTDPDLKLERLLVTHDDDFYYFGFDAPASGKAVNYGMYIDVDNIPGSGGTTDRWGKAIAAVSQHLPEIQMYAYHDADDSWSTTSPVFYHWDAVDGSWVTGSGGMARLPEGGVYSIDKEHRFFEIAVPRDAPGFDRADDFHVKLFTVGSTSGAGVSAVLPNDDMIRFTTENTSSNVTTLADFYWYNMPDTTTVIELPITVDGDPADWHTLEAVPVALATNTTQNSTQYKLDSLFVHMDEFNLYLGFHTAAVDEKMHFGIYIDTDNIGNSGGATNPWGAFVTTVPDYRPEIAIFAYHNELGGWSGTSPQYYVWTGSAWVRQSGGHGNMPPGGQFAHNQDHQFAEMLVPRDSPGLVDVGTFHIVLYNFGMTKYIAEVLPSDPLVAYTGQNPSVAVDLSNFAWYDSGTSVSVDQDVRLIPGSAELYQNYPNPFNPVTVIRFALPDQAMVKLEVFNTLGQKVATLADGQRAAGLHEARFNSAGLSSGIYLYRLQAGSFVKTRKMLLIR